MRHKKKKNIIFIKIIYCILGDFLVFGKGTKKWINSYEKRTLCVFTRRTQIGAIKRKKPPPIVADKGRGFVCLQAKPVG